MNKLKKHLHLPEKGSMKGFFRLVAMDADTQELLHDELIPNTLTNINREIRQHMLEGTLESEGYNARSLQIKFLAVGDGTSQSDPSDTQLQNELHRRPITSISSSVNTTTTITSFTGNEANFRIREIGVFCGDDASLIANSGIMISRVNVDFTKNSNIIFNVYRYDIININV